MIKVARYFVFNDDDDDDDEDDYDSKVLCIFNDDDSRIL